MGEETAPGLAEARMVGLERVPVRTREGSVTLSAWRLTVESAAGSGSIVLVDTPGGGSFYRGEGVFLGWTQDRMAGAFAALQPNGEEPGMGLPQLG